MSASEMQIEKLTNQILRKELDLERFYLLYRVHGTKEPKWRRLRYYVLQVGAASCTLASNIMFTKLAADGMRRRNPPIDFGRGDAHPQGFRTEEEQVEEDVRDEAVVDARDEGDELEAPESVNYLRQALIVNMIGVLLDGGSSCIELASNSFTALKNKWQKRSPSDAVKTVVGRLNEIDTLLKERKALVDQKPHSSARNIHHTEEKVLVAFRNWCLCEFSEVYADVKSTQTGNNLYYLLDVAADSVYLAGLIIGLRALNPGSEHLNGPSLNVSIVGDGLSIASVPLSSWGTTRVYNHYRKKMLKKLEQTVEDAEAETKVTMDGLKKEIDASTQSGIQSAGSVMSRMKAYLIWSDRYDAVIEKSLDELKHQAKVALQGNITGPAISTTYLMADILAHVGFYRFPTRPHTAAALGLGGSIAGTTGTSASLFFTNYNLISETLHRRKLRKQGLLPEQLLAERLKILDELDQMIIDSEKNLQTNL